MSEAVYASKNQMIDEDINCLMLHPVAWPNHGPETELYLAEEAIGLVNSLGWTVVKGPLWDVLQDEDDWSDSDAEYNSDGSERNQKLREAYEEGSSGPVFFNQNENRK